MQDAAATTIGARHRGQEQAAGLVEMEDNREGVRGVDAGDFRPTAAIELCQAAPLGLGVEVALPRPLDVLGGQRRTVLEVHPVAQGEGVSHAVVRAFDLAGQQRADGGVFTVGHQALDDVQHHRVGIFVTVDAGFGATDIGVQADTQGGLGLRKAGAQCKGDAQRSIE